MTNSDEAKEEKNVLQEVQAKVAINAEDCSGATLYTTSASISHSKPPWTKKAKTRSSLEYWSLIKVI
jgi:hypothetical protein